MPAATTRPGPEPALVSAALDGDPRALDALLAASLPLVYNLVGRALDGRDDVDDVVQETMLRVVRKLPELRRPEAYRSWLVAIAVRQARDSGRRRGVARLRTAAFDPAHDRADPGSDFAGATVLRLGLTDQRRDVAEATRWLDPEDRELLSLWWLEQSGRLERRDLATALGLSAAHAAVRVHRMKRQLDTSRGVVRALRDLGRCARLRGTAEDWDGTPNPLWRKRFDRHIRGCESCAPEGRALVPVASLLRGLPLVPVPAALGWSGTAVVGGTGGAFGPGSVFGGPQGVPGRPVRGARRARPRSFAAAHPVALAGAACVVAAAVAAGFVLVPKEHGEPAAALVTLASPSQTSASPDAGPSPSSASADPSPSARPSAGADSSPTPEHSTALAAAAPAVATGSRKGVGAWTFTGDDQALADSGASWFYTWSTSAQGMSAPGVGFVPMIWGSASVTAGALAQAKASTGCGCVLGFNEPDNAGQSNMTPAQALSLWPQLDSTGLELGSPAVASGAATPGGWLDQFMSGVRQDGYRVDFITLHWYGSDFDTSAAVSQLQSYIESVYARYRLPIWLTEFALISFANGGSQYPSEAQQAAFLTAATQMLDGLPYVQRYAWFGLGATSGSPSSGLFEAGPVATPVGAAFEAAR
jgi:RNA polymerase sigma factor (sigma-70 family)